jgi:Tectonin domain
MSRCVAALYLIVGITLFCTELVNAAEMPSMKGPWSKVSGQARDIGVDMKGNVWIVSLTQRVPGGYAIYRRNEQAWTRVDGSAVRIAVAPNGDVWTIEERGVIHLRRAGSRQWVTVPGSATEIRVAADGSVWSIGTEAKGDGFGIYRYMDSNWVAIDGTAEHIAAIGPDSIWIVKPNGDIYWRGKTEWIQQDKWTLQEGLKAADIALDPKGPAWLLGPSEADGNRPIFQDDGYHGYRKDSAIALKLTAYGYTNGFHWHHIEGSAVRIVTQPDGTPWLLRKDGSIYVSTLKLPSRDLLCTGFGAGYMLDSRGGVSKFYNGGCNQAAFDSDGALYMAVNLWRRTGSISQILKFSADLQQSSVIYSGDNDYIDNIYALAMGSHGDIYFANWYNTRSDRPKDAPADRPHFHQGAIFKIARDKTLSVVDPDAPRVYGLKCDSKGNLYNSGYSHDGDIFRYDLTDVSLKTQVVGRVKWNRANDLDSHGELFANGYCLVDPNLPDAIKGPDGQWVANLKNIRAGVFAIAKDGSQKLVVPEADRAESHPVGVACDPNGDIYIVDYYVSPMNPGVVYRCARDGSYTVYATGLKQPMWLTMAPTNVAERRNVQPATR